MTLPAAVEIARENAGFRLKHGLQASAQKAHGDPNLLSDIAGQFHTLGIVAVLVDADPLMFARFLALAGQTDLQCRSLDLAGEPRILMASRFLPFADALAAGDLNTARGVARLAPAVHQNGFEYEDDFLRYRFMHQLLLTPEDRLALLHLLDRWEKVANSDPGPYYALSRAMVDRVPEDFEEAMAAVLARRRKNLSDWRKAPDYRFEFDATEGSVFVLGLAYLRLAEALDIPTREDYDGMPSLTRVKLGTALPMPGAWRGG